MAWDSLEAPACRRRFCTVGYHRLLEGCFGFLPAPGFLPCLVSLPACRISPPPLSCLSAGLSQWELCLSPATACFLLADLLPGGLLIEDTFLPGVASLQMPETLHFLHLPYGMPAPGTLTTMAGP